jgi:hypothetical protein
MMLRPEPERRWEGVPSISDLSERTVVMNGLTDEPAARSMGSFSGYNRFGTTQRTAGAGAGKGLALIVDITKSASVFIRYDTSLNNLCCIILKLLK